MRHKNRMNTIITANRISTSKSSFRTAPISPSFRLNLVHKIWITNAYNVFEHRINVRKRKRNYVILVVERKERTRMCIVQHTKWWNAFFALFFGGFSLLYQRGRGNVYGCAQLKKWHCWHRFFSEASSWIQITARYRIQFCGVHCVRTFYIY